MRVADLSKKKTCGTASNRPCARRATPVDASGAARPQGGNWTLRRHCARHHAAPLDAGKFSAPPPKRRKSPSCSTRLRCRRATVPGLDLGADDYLVKPFDLGAAGARAGVHPERRSSGAPNPAATVAGSSSQTAARTAVTLDGALSHRPRARRLARRPAGGSGRQPDSDDHLFAEEDESYSNLLDVHVCNLRKKLGRNFIQSVRGHGPRGESSRYVAPIHSMADSGLTGRGWPAWFAVDAWRRSTFWSG